MRGGENLKLHTLFGWVGGGVKVGATGVCLSCWGNKKKFIARQRQRQMHWLGTDNSVKLTIFE